MKSFRNRSRRSVLSALLTILMLLTAMVPGGILPVTTAEAAGDVLISGDYEYTVDATGAGATIVGYRGSATTLSIPATVNGKNVTAIGYGAFSPNVYFHNSNAGNLGRITSVTIPEGVTLIDDGAFYRNTSLKTVTFPSTLTNIADYAFTGCSSLTAIKIPAKTKKIHKYAFCECSSLESIVVEKGNTKYDSRNDCNALIHTGTKTLIQGSAKTVIPSTINTIGEQSFACISISGIVTIPSGVKYVGDKAFIGNKGMTGVAVPNTVRGGNNSNDSDLDHTFGYDYDTSTAQYSLTYGTLNDLFATPVMNTEFVVYGYDGSMAQEYVLWELGDQLQFSEMYFYDVGDPNLYYFAPVQWGAETGIVGGYSDKTFRPNELCTRAQMVAFLWRMAGCPQPKTSQNPFKDVTDSSVYYYKAMLWAYENGILGGIKKSDGTLIFNPSGACTRGQAVTFLWRMAGCPEPASTTSPFADVRSRGKYYYKAALWASEQGITGGIKRSDGRYNFDPEGNCVRRQMVSFLMRYDQKF